MTDLTDRMRTCAAAIVAGDDFGDWRLVMEDAAALLIEAAGVLEVAPVAIETIEKLTEQPMEIIEPPPPGFSIDRTPSPAWIAPGASLPFEQAMAAAQARSNPRACPKCDSRAWKKVTHQGKQVMLHCPVCGAQWEWKAA